MTGSRHDSRIQLGGAHHHSAIQIGWWSLKKILGLESFGDVLCLIVDTHTHTPHHWEGYRHAVLTLQRLQRPPHVLFLLLAPVSQVSDASCCLVLKKPSVAYRGEREALLNPALQPARDTHCLPHCCRPPAHAPCCRKHDHGVVACSFQLLDLCQQDRQTRSREGEGGTREGQGRRQEGGGRMQEAKQQ